MSPFLGPLYRGRPTTLSQFLWSSLNHFWKTPIDGNTTCRRSTGCVEYKHRLSRQIGRLEWDTAGALPSNPALRKPRPLLPELGTGSHVYTTSARCLVTADWTWGEHLTVRPSRSPAPGFGSQTENLVGLCMFCILRRRGWRWEGLVTAHHVDRGSKKEKGEWGEGRRGLGWRRSVLTAFQCWLVLSFISAFPRASWAPQPFNKAPSSASAGLFLVA